MRIEWIDCRYARWYAVRGCYETSVSSDVSRGISLRWHKARMCESNKGRARLPKP
jgi:hypothetical protein